MSTRPTFLEAFPYLECLSTLPVTDIDAASAWYADHFGMVEIARSAEPQPAVTMKRDQVQIGFAMTGKDPGQDGAAILVSEIEQLRSDLEAAGVNVSEMKTDERDGKKLHAFFVVAPDGLCYYFHQPVSQD
ncbi:VOC family protein [Rhodopirellula sp. MGV]|uniref:VOC family protein n=1 Tax=Rhodopirellula sp. MGV TaxID=2023130 RepID=UPI000B963900|nr:VOC family protein [Rhodopirellula sp. MGV]OYP34740.1 glyoxalase [Rhodopirellula sp. MGV]PNY34305.1 VOC family protein [Rhodopirellula baltica]